MRRRRAPSKQAESKRGVALIMVLVITTIMAAIASDLSNEAAVNVRAAGNAKDELQAYFHARSAVELELFVLRFQGQLKGALENFIPIPIFELSSFLVSSDTMKGLLTNRESTPEDGLKKGAFAIDKPFGNFEGSFWVEEVVDENRKINLNNLEGATSCLNPVHTLIGAMMDDPKYDPLFETIGDSHDPVRNRIELIANMTDWVDGNDTVDPVCAITGDQTQSSVSEDTRYDHLPYNTRYKPKNGQMTSLAELRLVPGVNDAFMRLFAPYLTVWSDNRAISMRTADERLLKGVLIAVHNGPWLPGDEEKFLKFMEERNLLLALPPPLNKLTLASMTQIMDTIKFPYDPAKLKLLTSGDSPILRFEDISSVYRITAIGRVNNTTSTITLVWRDDHGPGEIYYWREE